MYFKVIDIKLSSSLSQTMKFIDFLPVLKFCPNKGFILNLVAGFVAFLRFFLVSCFLKLCNLFSRLDGLFVLIPDFVAVDDSQHSCSNAQDDKAGYQTDFRFRILFP